LTEAPISQSQATPSADLTHSPPIRQLTALLHLSLNTCRTTQFCAFQGGIGRVITKAVHSSSVHVKKKDCSECYVFSLQTISYGKVVKTTAKPIKVPAKGKAKNCPNKPANKCVKSVQKESSLLTSSSVQSSTAVTGPSSSTTLDGPARHFSSVDTFQVHGRYSSVRVQSTVKSSQVKFIFSIAE